MSGSTVLVIGCRPDCIKMLPLYFELKKRGTDVILLSLGQHRQLLDSVLDEFGVKPDYDLDVMTEGQTLFDVTKRVLDRIKPLLEELKPGRVLVHGDTTGAFAAALACFYLRIPVGHVEAGLRTGDTSSPFPEEFNRKSIDSISDLMFAPTPEAAKNLIAEGFSRERIFVTGNTVVDMLQSSLDSEFIIPQLDSDSSKLLILVTLHRRESFGDDFVQMLSAIAGILDSHPECLAVFPVHPNPQVKEKVFRMLGDRSNILLLDPMKYREFINLEARASLVITDSGGVQEEAATLGVPTLVLRDRSDRPPVRDAMIYVCGRRKDEIESAALALIESGTLYNGLHKIRPFYGDGKAAKRIADVLDKASCEEWNGNL